jgi:hypothetical protein
MERLGVLIISPLNFIKPAESAATKTQRREAEHQAKVSLNVPAPLSQSVPRLRRIRVGILKQKYRIDLIYCYGRPDYVPAIWIITPIAKLAPEPFRLRQGSAKEV